MANRQSTANTPLQDKKIIQEFKGGRLQDFSVKPIPSKHIIFKINLPVNQEVELFLKVKSVNKTIITASVNSIDVIEQLINRENIIFGVFTGVIVGLFFYNLFLFFSVRDKIYLIYVIHTVFVWFAQSSILGYTNDLIWPGDYRCHQAAFPRNQPICPQISRCATWRAAVLLQYRSWPRRASHKIPGASFGKTSSVAASSSARPINLAQSGDRPDSKTPPV
ncbi:MAG: hypothetical protein B7Z23_04960 [Pseudomonadales bacterium 32-61-5]|nr:MAG: hypothetical protein B7Z23_04960 [Pseudomonadales bacterium 32-61-5]